MIATEPRFWEQLRLSGLLDDNVIADLQNRLAVETPIDNIKATLLSEGLLTPFQIKRIDAGDTRHLVLGQYRVIDEIGRGGFACVYKATHAFMNRIVAIKLISPELAEDTRARTWFEREVQAVTQLCHPNIVMAYDANEIADLFFMVMEFVDGMNLDAVVRHHGPLTARSACEMLQQAARGLQYAHEKGLVHRDIKPANLLVPRAAADVASADSVLVKIADFGLARLYNNPANTLVLRNDRCFVGTPDYIAPEQARKVHEADIRSDLYSLGCSFYFALTGQRPFRGDNPLETVMMHMEQEPTPLSRLRPELPAALTAIVHKLMAKDPAKRFQTPGELASELTFVLSQDSSPDIAIRVRKTDRFPVIRPKTSVGEFQPTTVVEMGERPKSTGSSVQEESKPGPRDDARPEIDSASQTAPSAEEAVSAERLGDLWRQWQSVVASFAAGDHLHWDTQQYRLLHADLVATLKSLKKAGPVEMRPAYARAENLVRPWLNLRSLAAIDRPTILNLRDRCVRTARELGVAPRRSWIWAGAFTACALIAAAVGYLLQSSPWNSLTGSADVQRFVETNPILSLTSLTIVIPLTVFGFSLAFGKFLRR